MSPPCVSVRAAPWRREISGVTKRANAACRLSTSSSTQTTRKGNPPTGSHSLTCPATPRSATPVTIRRAMSLKTPRRSSPAARPGWAKRPLGGWPPTAPTSSSSTATSQGRGGRQGARRHVRARRRHRRSRVTAAVAAATEIAPLRTCIHCAGIGWAERTINRDGLAALPRHVPQDRRDQPDRHVQRAAARRVGHERRTTRRQRRARRDRQHRVGRGVRRADRPGRVLGVEGRRGRARRSPPRAICPRPASASARSHPASSTRRCSAACPKKRAPSSRSACSSRSGSASPTTSLRWRWRSCATTTSTAK